MSPGGSRLSRRSIQGRYDLRPTLDRQRELLLQRMGKLLDKETGKPCPSNSIRSMTDPVHADKGCAGAHLILTMPLLRLFPERI
jgi:hypothetical protein